MNKSGKNVKINFIYSTIYQMLAIITPLITSPYVSRVLGSEGVGAYSYTYSIASMFALFGMLGVNNYGNRTIASCCYDKEERSGILIGTFLAWRNLKSLLREISSLRS